MSVHSLCGLYLGQKKVREGRRDELSSTERKELEKARPNLELTLNPDGTFVREITRGTWSQVRDRITFTPTSFGGETLEEMRRRSTEMGRAFSLGFLFSPFELTIESGSLVSADSEALIYLEFRRESQCSMV